jgi:hypothetical protein
MSNYIRAFFESPGRDVRRALRSLPRRPTCKSFALLTLDPPPAAPAARSHALDPKEIDR